MVKTKIPWNRCGTKKEWVCFWAEYEGKRLRIVKGVFDGIAVFWGHHDLGGFFLYESYDLPKLQKRALKLAKEFRNGHGKDVAPPID